VAKYLWATRTTTAKALEEDLNTLEAEGFEIYQIIRLAAESLMIGGRKAG